MLFISKVYTHPSLLEKPINSMLLEQNNVLLDQNYYKIKAFYSSRWELW